MTEIGARYPVDGFGCQAMISAVTCYKSMLILSRLVRIRAATAAGNTLKELRFTQEQCTRHGDCIEPKLARCSAIVANRIAKCMGGDKITLLTSHSLLPVAPVDSATRRSCRAILHAVHICALVGQLQLPSQLDLLATASLACRSSRFIYTCLVCGFWPQYASNISDCSEPPGGPRNCWLVSQHFELSKCCTAYLSMK